MRVHLFTVYDSKVGAFKEPMAFESCGDAERTFKRMCMTPDNLFNTNPEDFTLFHLGSFDRESAKFELHATPVSLGTALQFKSQSAAA